MPRLIGRLPEPTGPGPALGPSGLLDFVFHALWALKMCVVNHHVSHLVGHLLGYLVNHLVGHLVI